MNKTMTLDELLEKMRGLENAAKVAGRNELALGWWGASCFIKEYRPALEAGMKGTLRFKRRPIDADSGMIWFICDKDGEPITGFPFFGGLGYSDKETCELHAETLGFTAVFVEEPENTDERSQ